MTNLEKIRNMTAPEMAKFLHSMALCGIYTCKECKASFICKPSGYFLEEIEKIIEVLDEEAME